MNWFRQGFQQLRKDLRQVLIISIIALFVLYLAALMPLFGMICAAIGLVLLQAAVYLRQCHEARGVSWHLHKRHLPSLLLTAMLTIPTHMMMGSLAAIFQGSHSVAAALGIVVVFSLLCALAYLLYGHAIGYIVLQNKNFDSALKSALQDFARNKWQVLLFTCLSATLLIIAALPYGIGLIIVLPLHFYTYVVIYQSLRMQA